MKQVMNYNKDNGLLNMITRTDPMIARYADRQLYLVQSSGICHGR